MIAPRQMPREDEDLIELEGILSCMTGTLAKAEVRGSLAKIDFWLIRQAWKALAEVQVRLSVALAVSASLYHYCFLVLE